MDDPDVLQSLLSQKAWQCGLFFYRLVLVDPIEELGYIELPSIPPAGTQIVIIRGSDDDSLVYEVEAVRFKTNALDPDGLEQRLNQTQKEKSSKLVPGLIAMCTIYVRTTKHSV